MIAARRGSVWVVAGLVCTSAWLVVLTGSAGAAVYWGDDYTVAAANLDGSGANFQYFQPPFPSPSSNPVGDVAVNSKYLFWVGFTGIGRVNFEGVATPQT